MNDLLDEFCKNGSLQSDENNIINTVKEYTGIWIRQERD